MSLLSLFQPKKSQIYELEQSDIHVNKQIFDLISKIEQRLAELNTIIKDNDLALKNAKIAELENIFLHLKSKLDSLLEDVKRIMDIEMKNKDYVIINDDAYIQDKYVRLQSMSSTIDELLELFIQHPAASELKNDLLEFISRRVNMLIDSITSIANDDSHLEPTYKKIEAL